MYQFRLFPKKKPTQKSTMRNGIDIGQHRQWNDTGIKFKVQGRYKLSWTISYFDATPDELVKEYDLVMKSKEYNRFEK